MIDYYKYNRSKPSSIRQSLCESKGLRFLLLLTALAGLVLTPLQTYADKNSLQEYDIKAAFIYNFAKYVSWPEKTFTFKKEPLILGLLGKHPFGSKINALDGKKIHKRTLKVITIKNYAQATKCHLLYISSSESRNLKNIWPFLKTKNILTISDMDNFAESGGMIELIVKDDKIRFIINPQAATRAGLSISSQLLKLAIILPQGP